MAWFRRRKDLPLRLLGVWLIAHGVFALVPISFPLQQTLLAVLAIAVGVLILLDR